MLKKHKFQFKPSFSISLSKFPKNKSLFILLLIFPTFSLFAQQVELMGKIQDSLNNPLAYVNMIATPLSQENGITFAISNNQGNYQLKLQPDISYVLVITHLGFSKLMDTLRLSKSTVKNFILHESTETLESVLVKAEMAMIVKEDTITYRVDNFRTGNEQKLRELLENLPGVEVDRDGNVTVNGKKVTKLMVEGKTFFTGSTKLGVNNIPADAVEEVVVLDDYHEVPFMKNLTESEEMALNIKLKEGKKKFVFGEVEIGGGIKERYLIHPTAFYYSPKTAINLIGDFNNIGKKSFTMQDYLEFEGGVGSSMDDLSTYFELYNSDFAKFLSQRNFNFQKNEFGAFSISQELGTNTRLNAYSINSFAKTKTKTTQEISYLTEENLNESRLNTMTNDLFFSLNKIELEYNPNYETDFKYEAIAKISNGNSYEYIRSETPLNTNNFNIEIHPENLKITQNLELKKQFSAEHTSDLSLNYTFKKNQNAKDWLFDKAIFSEIIPFVEDGDIFNLIQKTSSIAHDANFRLKHYWVLNNFNHIYPVIGAHFHNQSYTTLDYQQLQNGETNTFQNSGFNNDLNFRMIDTYFGLEFKKKIGNLILKPGLVYHYFFWEIEQFKTKIANKSKPVLLPKLSMEYEFSSGHKLLLNYKLKSDFSDVSQYANRLRLEGFNQLFKGNKDLENQLYHQFSLNYYRFNFFKGTFINAGINYTNRIKSVQNTTFLDGIDQINTPIYTERPQTTFGINGNFSKQINKLKFTLRGNTSWSNYTRTINGLENEYNSQSYSYAFKGETQFEKWPNLEIGFQQNINIFESKELHNEFSQLDPFVVLEYDFLKDFLLKVDYTYNYYENITMEEINRFQIGSASLSYWKENSLWSFEISIGNIFDVRYKTENSLTDFLILDRKIYIQPRTYLFKIAYKL